MAKDPLPPERIELIKCEIKKDLEQSLDAFALPAPKDSRDSSSDISIGKTDLLAKDTETGENAEGGVRKSGEGVGDNRRAEELFQKLATEVQRLKELMGKKIDKLDKQITERSKVSDAKMKKLIKDGETKN